ncbi:MAG: diaminopropionate ammonia-lyase [Candidatus Dormibacteria bacterium]
MSPIATLPEVLILAPESLPSDFADGARDPGAFHRTIPGYAPTPLRSLSDLARELGVGELWVKDESRRLGLPSFKLLGGSWAVHRVLLERAGLPLEGAGWAELRSAAAKMGDLTLVTATDGNHGRGVAHMARALGLGAVVLVPQGTRPARIRALEDEGAAVRVHPGSYDQAVDAAAAAASSQGWLLVADVATGTDLTVPGWVMDGYQTIFAECADQLPGPVDAVVVQAGVGALAGAAARFYLGGPRPPRMAVVEPLSAACCLASARAGQRLSIDATQDSIMVGLNCGTPSVVAWPYIRAAATVFCAIDDEWARQAMRRLAGVGIEAGESGAAGLAGLLALNRHPQARQALGLHPQARVLILNTEGATDPAGYRAVVGDIAGKERDFRHSEPSVETSTGTVDPAQGGT